ncbi:MAG: glutathione peroxidase [Planctomycetota bacterium]|nr:glutathione peroxidase [Planctomycetota bacterium]
MQTRTLSPFAARHTILAAGLAMLTLCSRAVIADDPTPPATPDATQPAAQPAAKPGETPAAKPAGEAPTGDGKGDAAKRDKDTPGAKTPPAAIPPSPMVLAYTLKDIDGKDVDLASFKGKVVLIVNVASNCGYTPQYAGLEKLYDDRKDKGFVILGFPANNFGEQEPGTNAEIKSFCTGKYNVSFPMFSKISVKGDDQHPLYKQLASQPKPIGGDPGWNFTKFLVDRNGNIVARFDSKTRPNDAKLLKQIDDLLAAPVPGSAPAAAPAAQ